MRRSNWKSKVLMLIAVVIGVLGGIGVSLWVNTIFPQATGLAFFGGMIVVAGLIIVIGTKVFRIGRE